MLVLSTVGETPKQFVNQASRSCARSAPSKCHPGSFWIDGAEPSPGWTNDVADWEQCLWRFGASSRVGSTSISTVTSSRRLSPVSKTWFDCGGRDAVVGLSHQSSGRFHATGQGIMKGGVDYHQNDGVMHVIEGVDVFRYKPKGATDGELIVTQSKAFRCIDTDANKPLFEVRRAIVGFIDSHSDGVEIHGFTSLQLG